jgi:hypothetical protein
MIMLTDLFGSMITKVLSILTILFLSTSILMTHLYLGTRDDLASLKSTYAQLKHTAEEGEKSKEKVVEGDKQDDSILVDKTERIDSLTKDKESLLKRLSAIPKCTPVSVKGAQDVQVNIDDELPPDVTGLLNESYNQNKRSSNSTK